MRFRDQTAVVSGGAAGIGEAIVRALVDEGAAVAFLDKNEVQGSLLAAELSTGGRCVFVPGDICNEQDCRAVVGAAEAMGSGVDVLVNNAALFLYRTLDATAQEWVQVLHTNLIGPSILSRYATESMKRRRSGAIVNMSSISALIAQRGTMTYNVTKAGILQMTRCMAADLGAYGIRVNSVCPGYTLTQAFFDYASQTGDPAGFEAELVGQTILNRLAKPEEIAKCALFLASSDASYVTGSVLTVDGGVTIL